MKTRPKILSIAGFDPSGGAGVLADIKTFESHKCYGFGVCTANTIQNENEFIVPNWIDEKEVLEQIVILQQHQFTYVKIGLIPSLDFLKKIISVLFAQYPTIKIIWDPILSASSGFKFDYDLSNLKKILKNIYLITPNWNEIKVLSNSKDAQKGAKSLATYTNVYLKGGHHPIHKGKDYFYFEGKVYPFNAKKKILYDKHGSGCVFSSALTANLALNYPIIKACLRSKTYINQFLNSSPTLLGNHKI